MTIKKQTHKKGYKTMKILNHIIAISLGVYTLRMLFTIEIFSLLDTCIMLISIVYCVYVYMVYWDITKN